MIYGKNKIGLDAAKVDGDIVAFAVAECDAEEVAEMLQAAIFTACMIEFGTIPMVFE